VAGAVGLILCEIWEWYEGTKTDRDLAIGYGRGLQSVNILRNGNEDAERGVTFYPPNWQKEQVICFTKADDRIQQEKLEDGPSVYDIFETWISSSYFL
jgi:farnesyl-diphosphate farnesyltransferase